MEFLPFKLAAKLKSIPPWLWVLLLGIVLLFLAQCSIDRKVENAREQGAAHAVATEQAKQSEVILKNVEQASDAKAEIRDPLSTQRYNVCLLSARSPQNCKRFLPAGSDDLGGSRP